MVMLRFLSISINESNSANIPSVTDVAKVAPKRTSLGREPVLGNEICVADEFKSGVRSTATSA